MLLFLTVRVESTILKRTKLFEILVAVEDFCAAEGQVAMRFCYTGETLIREAALDQNTFLLTNGLGGYVSASAGFSAPRSDQGILVAAVKAPNERINMVHRVCEVLEVGEDKQFLTAQRFADGTGEDGETCLLEFDYEKLPSWEYETLGVRVQRQCVMAYEENTSAILYRVENRSEKPCTLTLTPFFKFVPKEDVLTAPFSFTYETGKVTGNGHTLYIDATGEMEQIHPLWQTLSYSEDAKDGRPDRGMAGACCRVRKTVAAGETAELEVVFSAKENAPSAKKLREEMLARLERVEENGGFQDPVARQLTLAADAYIARRDSTDGKTILAGYPLFSDWGRDTMIALPGCCFATNRFEDAKSILRTFLAYEKDGLVPNLFPEGGNAPMYNTVDAALLLIDCVWQYVQRTGDWEFAREAWPHLENIVACYRTGTHHGIGMDTDGLIFAGQGLDQVTWMDVCVQGVLPTPRHGKPVEINAYWHNALVIMDAVAKELALDTKDYAALAETVKRSFLEKFYIPEKGYLKDVLSGTEADEQIRCNQIWALSMSFTMLPEAWEKAVLATVEKHLYTPWGLRTLSPEDKQYHGYYGGEQFDRDMAYHQGTTWVFPMGAFYRAKLRIEKDTRAVEKGLANLQVMMTQGCAGQLPEIYDGDHPYEGKGCFGQAWSVGEMLRVFELLEKDK